MTFTRLTDDATLEPLLVFGPFQTERDSRNIATPLLHSSAMRVTYSAMTHRTGEFQLLFETFSEAKAGVEFFAAQSEYTFDGPEETVGGGLEVVDGYVVETDPTPDPSFDLRFVVVGVPRISQNGLWEVYLPYAEVPEP